MTYLFSAGQKGGGPNEVIQPRDDYFASSDSSFYILDSSIEREIVVRGDSSIQIIKNTPIIFYDAINRLVQVDDESYIMGGYTDGRGYEHIMYKDGTCGEFGEYPVVEGLHAEEKAIFNYKFTVGRKGKDVILDFYLYQNLIRIYDINGNLKQEVKLGGIPEKESEYSDIEDGSIQIYRGEALVGTNKYVYSLYYENVTEEQLYEDFSLIPELQVWSWEGKLLRRIRFDKPFNRFAVDKDEAFYAIDTNADNAIVYMCDLSK